MGYVTLGRLVGMAYCAEQSWEDTFKELEELFATLDPNLSIHKNQLLPMAIRAKFRCNSVTDNGYGLNASLTAVYGKEGENADYAKASPSGTLQINIDKETKAAGFFIPLKEYYMDFTPVD